MSRWLCGCEAWNNMNRVKGYLAHKEPHPPGTLQKVFAIAYGGPGGEGAAAHEGGIYPAPRSARFTFPNLSCTCIVHTRWTTLDIGIQKGPREGRVLMIEVPLYVPATSLIKDQLLAPHQVLKLSTCCKLTFDLLKRDRVADSSPAS